MTGQVATAADIEIIERVTAAHFEPDATGARSLIAPNEVRINGLPVLCTDDPITISPIERGSCVTVTLTVFARSIRIGAEPEAEVAPAADAYLQGVSDGHTQPDGNEEPEPVAPSAVVGRGGIRGVRQRPTE